MRNKVRPLTCKLSIFSIMYRKLTDCLKSSYRPCMYITLPRSDRLIIRVGT